MSLNKIFSMLAYLLLSLSLNSEISRENTSMELLDEESKNRAMWQGWSLVLEGGTHFKTLTDADFSAIKPAMGHDSRFWGEMGIFGGPGFKYARTFKTNWYWDIKSVWSLFYPDIRWEGASSKITLGSIPLIGKYINFGSLPGYWTMLLIPVLYFDIGYINQRGILFAIGSVYLWGLSPSVTIPFDNNWSIEFRSTLFLDRLFFNVGYHNFLMATTLNYKF